MKNYKAGQLIATIDASDGDQNTDLYPLYGYSLASIQIIWDSLDDTDSTISMETTDSDGTAWDTKTGTTVTMSTASASESLSLAGNATCQAIRFAFTANSATSGTISIYGTLKE